MDLLTTDLDKPGRSWIRQPSAAAASRPVRQVRTGLDSPNLATDQMINDVSPGMTPTTDTNALGHCRTGLDTWERIVPRQRQCWTSWPGFASKGSGVRVPLAPPGKIHPGKIINQGACH